MKLTKINQNLQSSNIQQGRLSGQSQESSGNLESAKAIDMNQFNIFTPLRTSARRKKPHTV